MKVELVAIERVKPYERNPRKNAAAVDKVAASIREFGWRQPIVVDDELVVIAGHTRLLAAHKLGEKKVPVLVAKDLTPAQVRAYRLADNRTHEEAEWDPELLRLELGDLDALDFDLALTGFDPDELAALLNAVGAGADAESTPEPPANPVSVLGDLWLLGDHRVLCGDSTSADAVGKLLADAKPHLMVTDPPYGVNYDPSWREGADLGVGKRSKGKVENDDRADWTEAWVLFPGDVVYAWHGGLHSGEVQASLAAAGFEMRAQIVWSKQHFVMSRGDYHWQHEPCWYAVRKGKRGGWAGDRKQTTVWEIANNNSFGNRDKEQTWGHGTQKPVECMRRPIVNNSKAGDAVYDPFLGSGTTLIAAAQEARICFGLELNPAYVDVIVKRWQEFAGGTATLEGDGRSFDDVAAKRKKKAA